MAGPRAAQLLEAGLWLQMSGDLEGARRLFQEALKIDPGNARARALLEGKAAAIPRELERAPAQPRTDAFSLPEGPAPSSATGWDVSGRGWEIAEARPEPMDAMGLLETGPSLTPVPPPIPAVADKRSELTTLLRGAEDLMALDDHTGAMELLAKAEALAPGDPEVAERRARSEGVLEAMLQAKLGPLTAVPTVQLPEDEIIWLNLDHRAGFMLAQIDGTVSFDDLFAISGMSRLDTARILVQLLDEGVIAAR